VIRADQAAGELRARPPSPARLAAEAFARAEFEQCREYLRLCGRDETRDAAAVALLRARLARIDGDFESWYAAAVSAERIARSTEERM